MIVRGRARLAGRRRVWSAGARSALPELRKAVPAKYPIRDYPDITHSLRCQYPVPDWDVAYSLTEGREVINPRPRDEAAIFHAFADQTIGFITYSEGCNDDVNKIVWSALGWDPDAESLEILRHYSRYFLGLAPARRRRVRPWAAGSRAKLAGAALDQRSVETTLPQFRAMEQRARPDVLANWRFQQALYRAYYDAYVRSRLIRETDLEAAGAHHGCDGRPDRLAGGDRPGRGGFSTGPPTQPVGRRPAAADLCAGRGAFPKHPHATERARVQGDSVGRGATLDTIDAPLNNRQWLQSRFDQIRKLDGEAARLSEIDAIINWTNPGPGGFYDDLGDPRRRPHLVMGSPF